MGESDWSKFAKLSNGPLYKIGWFIDGWPMYRPLLPYLKDVASILEIGSSTGMASRVLSKKLRIKKITLLDKNKTALEIAHNNPIVNCVCQDARNINLREKFDLVHSGGLLEHFSREDAKLIINNHIKYTNKYVFIYIPKNGMRYWIFRRFMEFFGQWIFGYENPFLPRELLQMFPQTVKIIKIVRNWHYFGVLAKTI